MAPVAVAASLGAGLVIAFHIWDKHQPEAPLDCATFGECIAPAVDSLLLLIVGFSVCALVLLLLVQGIRAWLVVPISLAAQGAFALVAIRVVPASIPVAVQVVLGALTWAIVAFVVDRF